MCFQGGFQRQWVDFSESVLFIYLANERVGNVCLGFIGF